jgi:toxin HigB-1
MRIAHRPLLKYDLEMIKSIRHKGLQRYFEEGDSSKIQSDHVKKLRTRLTVLDTANSIEDIDRPGFALHLLKGTMKGRWAISVSGNWRLTFEFKDGDVWVLDYEDYH